MVEPRHLRAPFRIAGALLALSCFVMVASAMGAPAESRVSLDGGGSLLAQDRDGSDTDEAEEEDERGWERRARRDRRERRFLEEGEPAAS